MKRVFTYTVLLGISLVFTRCSWIEQFIIINESDKAIYVNYELIENPGAFPIFTDHPSVYPVNSSGNIEWGKDMAFADEDPMLNKVSIVLPPRSVLVFGGLHNDTYKAHDQKFINGRVFNLKKIQLLFNNKILDIEASSFDDHFKKRQGQIRLLIK